jgi:ribosomal protein S18 acetylase RimI-like enzyme
MELMLLAPDDGWRLKNVAPEVFDNAVEPGWAQEFLADPRHHIAVAIEDGCVVGFASGVHYVHPDKPAELFVNEVGVARTHQRQGLGRAVLQRLLDRGRALGCVSAWVLTDRDNVAAQGLYGSVGGEVMGGEMVGFEFPLTP